MQILESTALIVFWAACAMLFMNYFGLYMFLNILSLFSNRVRRAGEVSLDDYELPTVDVLVAARNEEAVIEARVRNLLDQDYPADKLKIIIASDDSDDRTSEIVKSFVNKQVELREMPERAGQLGIYDQVIPTLRSEITLLTDANVMFKPDAVRQVVYKYADSRVGAVSGNQRSIAPAGKEQMVPEENYRNFETNLKQVMAKLGILIGCYGGIFSLRQKLFRPVGAIPMNADVAIPLEILAQNYRVDFAAKGLAYEETEQSIQEEFNRRKRIITYNIPMISRGLRLTSKAGVLPLFTFINYKVIRWLSPLLFMLIIVTAAVLASSSLFFVYVSAIIALWFILSIFGFAANRKNIRIPVASYIYYFTRMNFAVFIGYFEMLKGITHHWAPRGE